MCKTYDVINEKIMELLQQGTIPWRKTWNAESNYPKNLITKKDYRGINHFILSCMPYSSPYYLTFKQVQDKGGHVKKGERSCPVVFWKWIGKGDVESEEQDNTKGQVPLLRYYNVFNIDQTEGLTIPVTKDYHQDHQPLPGPEEIIKNMPLKPEIRFGGNQPAYYPYHDYIQLPHMSNFEGPEDYYVTMYHELIHSTGHASRLGRKGVMEPSYFGLHEYSKEELVAEMGAAFLCGITGTDHKTIENSAAYIQGWLKALKNDQAMLIHAAAQAQKAADYIMNRKGGEEEVVEEQVSEAA